MQTKKNMRRASVDEQRLPSHEDFEGEIFLKKTIRIVDNFRRKSYGEAYTSSEIRTSP